MDNKIKKKRKIRYYEETYRCEICDKEFVSINGLKSHMNRENMCTSNDLLYEGKKIYICNICNKIFKNKTAYTNHMNRKLKCKKNEIIEDLNDDEIHEKIDKIMDNITNINKDFRIIDEYMSRLKRICHKCDRIFNNLSHFIFHINKKNCDD
jgi:uncharacterized C2H2 Zn-finger protein